MFVQANALSFIVGFLEPISSTFLRGSGFLEEGPRPLVLEEFAKVSHASEG